MEEFRRGFHHLASPCIATKDMSDLSEPAEARYGVSSEQFVKMVRSFGDRVKVSINLKNMVTDVRRYETTEATRLFSDL